MSTAFNSVSRVDSPWASQGAVLASSQSSSTDANTHQFSALLSQFTPPPSPTPTAASLNSSQQEQDKLISGNQARAQETEHSLSQRAESQRQENNRQALKPSSGSTSQSVSESGAQAQSNASASKLNLPGRLALTARPASAAADAAAPNLAADGGSTACAQARAARAPSAAPSDKDAPGTASRSDTTATDAATVAATAAAAQQSAATPANATSSLIGNASAADAQADGATDTFGTAPSAGATAKRGSLGAPGRADLHGKPGSLALNAQPGANPSTDANATVADGKDKSVGSFAAQLQSAGQAPDATTNSAGQAASQTAGQGAEALATAASKPEGLSATMVAHAQASQAPSDAPPNGAATSTNISLPQPLHSAAFVPEMAARLSVLASQGVQEAHLHLNPAEMGPVAVQIVVDGQQAQISFHADNAQTREVLERGLPDLAAALRDNGLTLSGGGVFQQMNQQSQTSQNQANDGQSSGSGVRQADRSILSMNDNGVPAATRPVARATQGVVDLYA
ncbi:flagellar hook-length control protein FliK [Roseateles koreensis]|uniref:Flagellar hook-length control protein FliK n=1 Tax=Roseateles koreensis TaxID=2987526 RepID=A0ABT5KTV1_9BURK|nr:flagellar hook-length control protein FliK [Roseateles koreensis]MDC8786362.1 flagellar hook-length control protein FliK [Roseateles koreensis]